MRRNIFNGILLSFLFAFILILSACTDDDWKNDVDRLKEEIEQLQNTKPTGIIILNTDTLQITKGHEFEITFRTNPSGYQLNIDNLELDVESNTYSLYKEDKSLSRSSYVRPSQIFEIVSLVKNRNENEEELTGEWIITIRTKGEENFMDYSKIRLVANYLDSKGEKQYICSSNFAIVQTLPTLEEGLNFYNITQTYRAYPNSEIIPYRIFAYCNIYMNNHGETWVYNRNNLTTPNFSFSDPEQQNLFNINTDNLNRYGYITLTPTESTFWTTQEEEKGIVQIPATLTLSNKLGESLEKDILISYCMQNQESITIETTQQEIEENNRMFTYDLTETFDKLGFPSSMELPYKIFSKQSDSKGGIISSSNTEELYYQNKLIIKVFTSNLPDDNYYQFSTRVEWMAQENGIYIRPTTEDNVSFLQYFNIKTQIKLLDKK